MLRRTVLLACGGMIFGTRLTQAAGRRHFQDSVQVQTGQTAARVARNGRQFPQARRAVRLCQLLSEYCKKNPPVSPALVQATLDTCVRVCKQQPQTEQQIGFRKSVADFQRLAERLVQTLTV